MSLDQKIIEIRKNNNLSQENLAEILNVSRQTVSNWENLKCYPDIQTLIIISDKFKISLDELLREDMKMVKDIDKKVSKNSKLKMIIIILVIFIVAGTITIFLKNYLNSEKRRKDEARYQEIIYNLNELGFEKRDEIGFSTITENGVSYSIYSKMPSVLEPRISAKLNLEDVIMHFDYDGKRAGVTYTKDKVVTIYCNKNGEVINDKANKNNIKVYNDNKDIIVEVIGRMVELFDGVYN